MVAQRLRRKEIEVRLADGISCHTAVKSRSRASLVEGVFVNYKQYLIETFEREPKIWRARIKRLDGRNIRVHVPQMEHASITTAADSSTAETAADLAKKAIDAGRMI